VQAKKIKKSKDFRGFILARLDFAGCFPTLAVAFSPILDEFRRR
jgi:hypothetical protein